MEMVPIILVDVIILFLLTNYIFGTLKKLLLNSVLKFPLTLFENVKMKSLHG